MWARDPGFAFRDATGGASTGDEMLKAAAPLVHMGTRPRRRRSHGRDFANRGVITERRRERLGTRGSSIARAFKSAMRDA